MPGQRERARATASLRSSRDREWQSTRTRKALPIGNAFMLSRSCTETTSYRVASTCARVLRRLVFLPRPRRRGFIYELVTWFICCQRMKSRTSLLYGTGHKEAIKCHFATPILSARYRTERALPAFYVRRMQDCCLFFRRMPTTNQLYALAICAHLPLNGAELEVRRFTSEQEFASALKQVGVQERERQRIAKALQQSGRTLTHFTRDQVKTLRTTPLADLPAYHHSSAVRPRDFDMERVTARAVAYQMLGPQRELTSSGGVLPAGREVWLESKWVADTLVSSARAFVEGIGLIVLSTRWLCRKEPIQ